MKKGFTLIELLAVIVILAIIALIATPIVLSIISDSKESSNIRSAEMYLDAVELSVAQSTLKDQIVSDGTYKTMSDGNICLGYESDGVTCVDVFKVEVKGEVPSEGSTITIVDGEIKKVKLTYEEKEIVKDIKNNLIYFEKEYEIGQEVTFDPGDGEKTWNVIDEDATTVTLMLTENLGDTVDWYEYSNHNTEDTSNYGPKDALDYLNSLTTEWDNVDPIESYSYINNKNGTTKPYGYQKIEIKNGKTKLTHKNGTTTTDIAGESKARLLTLDEVFEIAQKTNTNLTEENLRAFIEKNLETLNSTFGTSLTTVDEVITFATQSEGYEWLQYESKYYQTYITVWGIETTYDILLPSYLYQKLYSDKRPLGYWTFSSHPIGTSSAWNVYYDGLIGHDFANKEQYRGVRPVITISKSLPLQIVEE